MDFKNKKIGYAITGSFCTFKDTIEQIKKLTDLGAYIKPVMSFNAYGTDTRFGKAKDIIEQIESITKNKIINTIKDAEPIGPENDIDAFIIAPCTGNTLAKMKNGICDTPALMAVKAHIRNNKPVVIAISTNDGLGANMSNIGSMMNTKNIYFVPFGQDNYIKKTKSLVAHFSDIPKTLYNALNNIQIQPVLKQY